VDQSTRDKYRVVIGLEVHAQLLTKSKIYSSDAADFGSAPNTNISIISLGHPGTLPKLNRKAVECAIRMGLACHCEIAGLQVFDRKNYFYPDLPKGYQITQDRTPICKGGYVTVHTESDHGRNIGLHRIHIEEDAGKSIHITGETDTLVDFNRAGVALIEIVTLPEVETSDEAYAFLTEVRKLVRYLDICDGNMEEGSLRCDANVSVMLKNAVVLGKKVEVKNMNSIRNVQRAIDHEIERQIMMLEEGNLILSETRTFDASDGTTHGMRMKEELNDYRYFPDPDLSPLVVNEKWLQKVRASMPMLPDELFRKLIDEFHLSEYDAQVLTDNRDVAFYFLETCRHTGNFKAAANWIMGPIKSYLNDGVQEINHFGISPVKLAEMIALIDEGKLNFAVASQKLLPAMLIQADRSALELAQSLNLVQDSREDIILTVVEEVLKEFPLKVEEYQKGKKGIMSMFMGEVMKRTKGKADPRVATHLLEKKLSEV
jgi:aspartyl-tRNA(Asn)/glutamyl-tRNA(Gln) amidotransferase subunit B